VVRAETPTFIPNASMPQMAALFKDKRKEAQDELKVHNPGETGLFQEWNPILFTIDKLISLPHTSFKHHFGRMGKFRRNVLARDNVHAKLRKLSAPKTLLPNSISLSKPIFMHQFQIGSLRMGKHDVLTRE